MEGSQSCPQNLCKGGVLSHGMDFVWGASLFVIGSDGGVFGKFCLSRFVLGWLGFSESKKKDG